MQPSPYDVWAAKEIVDLLAEATVYKPGLKGAFVINRKLVNTAIGRDVADALSDYPVVILKSAICQRVAFAESAAQGLTVFELDADMPGSKEIEALAEYAPGSPIWERARSPPRSACMTQSTESKWRSLIAEQERSGMTVREFAASRSISPTTLYWWRCRLRRRRVPDLVPVEVVEREIVVQARHERAAAFELCVDGSLTLRIPPGFDEAELRRLVRALRC